ncbi:MAG: thiol peroxidase [Phycisphaerae bacterium]|jgi:thiol peroxidase|nr:thiol peroxidase [Phycisphaerae bacterium]
MHYSLTIIISLAAAAALFTLAGCTDGGSYLERIGAVTMKGNPKTLVGPDIQIGKPVLDFRVVDMSFAPVRLSDFAGKPILISAVPSLDTGICSLQTKRFNEEIAKLPENVVVISLSTDLPFAQKRFCDAEKVDRIKVLSDSVHRDFALKYGVLIKDMGLLARSIFVIGKDSTLLYKEIVPEIASHPDYDKALAEIRKAAQ